MKQFIGKQFAHYQLNALLGEGGMGVVYHAHDLQSGHPVAVKIMLANLTNKPPFRQRFAQEAQAVANFHSPAIIKMYDTGQFEETPYMAMEYVEGGSLTNYLKQLQWSSKRMPLNDLVALGAQIMEGLAYAHQRGIIHRDIKPDNILLKLRDSGSGAISQAVISDFGLAIMLKKGDELATNPFMGSLAYMSPEQCRNMPIDGRSDIYSAGIMLYQLATGQLPFQIKAPVDIIKHVEDPPLPPNLINPELPQAVEDIILKAIAKKPSERFQTAAEMAHALRRISTDEALLTAVPHLQKTSEVTRWLGNKWVAGVNVQDRVDMNKTWTSEGSYRLFVTNQYEESHIFGLNKDELTIGRSPDNDIVLDDQAISARHVSLKRTMMGWQVHDLGSTNGTYIGDRSLEFDQEVAWSRHEVLRIGPYFLKWQMFEGGAGKSLPTAAAAPPAPDGRHNGKPTGYTALPLAAMGTAVAPSAPQPPPVDEPIEPLGPLEAGYESAALDVTITPDTIELESEIELPLDITITNRDTIVKDITVRMFDENGRRPHWARLSQHTHKLLPGETAVIHAEIDLPENNDLLAGDHPLNVQVTTDKGETAITPIRLIMPPHEDFALDMHPSNLQEGVICRVAINDRSNFANEYTVVGKDDSDALLFDFQEPQNAILSGDFDTNQQQQQLKLAPGANAQASFTIRPRKRPWFSRDQIHPFKVHLHTQNTDEWQTLTGQVTINPRISLRVFLLFLLLALILGGAIAYLQVTSQRELEEYRAAAQLELEAAQERSAAAEAEAAAAASAAEDAQNAVDRAIAEGKSAEEIAALEATAEAAAAEATAAEATAAEAAAAEAAAAEAAADGDLLPTGIKLSVTAVEENSPANTTVGVFSTTLGESALINTNVVVATSYKTQSHSKKQRQAATFTYSLVSGTGDDDNSAFIIDGDELKTRIVFDFETQSQYSINVQTADDNGNVFAQSFTITISDANDAPVFSSLPVITVQEDDLYSYSVLVDEPDSGDTAVITASSKPGWLSLVANGNEALLSGTPTNDDVGNHTVTLLTTDSAGETDTQNFTITVENSNDPPVFNSNNSPAPAATEDTAYSHTIIASDPDADDTLTISLQSSPDWLSLTDNGNGTAILTGTPTNDDVTTHEITLLVTDSAGVTGEQVLNITVSNTNDAPTFTSTQVTNVEPTKLYTYNIRASDVDIGDTLVISNTSTLPDWLRLTDNGDGTATLTGTPGSQDVGSHPIALKVTDAAGEFDMQSFTLVVKDVNDAPVINDQTLSVDENTGNGGNVGTVTATDPDGDTLTYVILSGNTNDAFAINANTGEITVNDTNQLDFENGPNSFALTTRVTDDGDGNLSDTAIITININNLNDEIPVITEFGPYFVVKDAALGTSVGTLIATDADANTTLQDWTIVENNDTPTNNDVPFAIGGTSGQLTVNGTLNFNTNPNYLFNVTVSDGINTSAQASVTVNILNDNIAPELDNEVQLSLTDIDEDDFISSGNLISAILASDSASNPTPITDANAGDPIGIAVINVDNTNGAWEYKLVSNWIPFPANIGEGAAVLLDDNNRIRFVPNPDYHTVGVNFDSIEFRAWDQSLNRPPGTQDVNTASPNNGSSFPFSTAMDTITITVTSIPDVPVANNFNTSTEEDTLVNVDVLSQTSDADGDPLTIIIGTATNGTATVNNNGTPSILTDDTVDFTPAPDFNGTGALFTYTVDDGSSSSTEATVSVTVTAVNDVPVIGGVNGSTATYILTTAIPITFTGTITDVDSIFNGGTLTATIATNLTTGDQLAIEEDKYIRLWGASNNIVAYTPTGVNGTADRIGEWTGGTGTNPLVITFDKDAATSDAVQALLRRIAFSATNLGTGPRTVEFTLTDGDGGTSDTATVTINVVP